MHVNIQILDLVNIYFMTTFLHTRHSLLAKLGQWGWLMRMRLAWNKSQKTLDTSKRLHQNETRSTGSLGKGFDSQPYHYWEQQTREWAGSSLPGGSWEGDESHTQAHPLPRDCWLYGDPSPRTPLIYLRIIYNGPPSRPNQVDFMTSRSRAYFCPIRGLESFGIDY